MVGQRVLFKQARDPLQDGAHLRRRLSVRAPLAGWQAAYAERSVGATACDTDSKL